MNIETYFEKNEIIKKRIAVMNILVFACKYNSNTFDYAFLTFN